MLNTFFWKCTAERAVKSFAQSLLAILGVGSVGVLDVAWPTALSTAGMAALLSVLTSLASAHVGSENDPSLVRVDDAAPAQPATAAA